MFIPLPGQTFPDHTHDRQQCKLAQLDWPVPDFSTVCCRQKTLRVQLTCMLSAQALHLQVDSTGIKFFGEGECKRKKHGTEYRRA